MQKLIASVVSRLVISVPYLWMLIFFLIPFIIVFKISLSQVTMAIPPYTPTIDVWAGWQGLINSVSQFSWDNYTFLGSDPLYVKAYLSSVIIAAISTFLTLLVGYPIAYGMARAPATVRSTLLMLVILP
ncbi:putrescine ABC transporter permease PotH, partial [Escherichia coli]|nr:putrescine ABC transporter permease PotH [Escherichia coli]